MSEIDQEQTITEADLARELGVAKEEVRELRKKLLAPTEFSLSRHGMAMTPSGAEKIRTALGLKNGQEKKEAADLVWLDEPFTQPELTRLGVAVTDMDLPAPAAPEKKERAAGGDGEKTTLSNPEGRSEGPIPWEKRPVETLYVRCCPINRRIVLACHERDLSGPVLRVKVKDNVNFIPRMELRVKHQEGTLYVLVGRCPRFRGRY